MAVVMFLRFRSEKNDYSKNFMTKNVAIADNLVAKQLFVDGKRGFGIYFTDLLGNDFLWRRLLTFKVFKSN